MPPSCYASALSGSSQCKLFPVNCCCTPYLPGFRAPWEEADSAWATQPEPLTHPPPSTKHDWLHRTRKRGGKYNVFPLSFCHLFMHSLTHTLTHLLNTHSPSPYVLRSHRSWCGDWGAGGGTHLCGASSHHQIRQPACSSGGRNVSASMKGQPILFAPHPILLTFPRTFPLQSIPFFPLHQSLPS